MKIKTEPIYIHDIWTWEEWLALFRRRRKGVDEL